MATIITCIILVIIIALAIWRIVSDKKKGRPSCGGSCENCPSSAFGNCNLKNL